MNNIDHIWQLSDYQGALLALALLCLMVLIQSFLTAPLAFLKKEQVPGKPLNGDHRLLSFRVLRTHANSVESLGPFGLTVLLGVLVAAHVGAMNWSAVIHVFFRLCFWVVYYSGKGKVAGGMRSLCFVGGMIANFALVITVLLAII